jgi:hypothetical protein
MGRVALVVDDDPLVLDLGCEVICARNGDGRLGCVG